MVSLVGVLMPFQFRWETTKDVGIPQNVSYADRDYPSVGPVGQRTAVLGGGATFGGVT